MTLPPALNGALRLLSGAAVLALGFGLMKMLIGMKEDAPTSMPPPAERLVRVEEVRNGEVVAEVPVEGRVEAVDRIDVLAEVGGVLMAGGKEFREGVAFRKGEVLLRIDDSEARAALTGSRATFLQSLAGALADFRMDFPERAAVWEGWARSIRPERTLPEMPDPGSDRERFFWANRGVLGSYHSIRSSEERLAKYTVRAPFDGVVATALVDPGALVRAGTPVGTLVGGSSLELRSALRADYLEVVEVGDAVTFADGSGQEVARGRIARITRNIDAASQAATVYCSLSATGKGTSQLRDGMYLNGKVRGRLFKDAVAVHPGIFSAGNAGVWCIGAKGELVDQPVAVAFLSAEVAIVRGVPDGTRVLASPVAGARAGLAVKIAE